MIEDAWESNDKQPLNRNELRDAVLVMAKEYIGQDKDVAVDDISRRIARITGQSAHELVFRVKNVFVKEGL